MHNKIGLILTGGGARSAYQVGVLKAIAKILPRTAPSPFSVICGTSAGAVNAVALAINADSFRGGVKQLLSFWKDLRTEDVYRSDPIGAFSNSARWFAGLLLSAFGSNKFNHVSLLDNAPLKRLLQETLPLNKIQESLDAGYLQALGITASGYTTEQSVTFFQAQKDVQSWQRSQRLGLPTLIEIDHLLASSAIPFLFPAVRINREYFGDGSMRQIAPISPALHLGAKRVMIIGMGRSNLAPSERIQVSSHPSLAQIAGHALNSIFLDTMELDLERLRRINHTVSLVHEERRSNTTLGHVDVLVIEPSQRIDEIAKRYISRLPWSIRFMLRGIGAMRSSGANLVNYLLFEKGYCRALIELGYHDAMQRKEEILAFLGSGAETKTVG
ncbi:MAG: patatin-like phospholipase family protein [Gallionella sp.]